MTKTDTKSTVLLKHHLKALKLPTIHNECEKIAQRCAADNADHLAYLLQLSELELIERERKAAERRLTAARRMPHAARGHRVSRQCEDHHALVSRSPIRGGPHRSARHRTTAAPRVRSGGR